ncbi:MAG: HAMP domain-containing sensor histidine kinase [Acidimicrobiia bacterium]|nr:HAMP domain-containing sensor histidine kinase [Acidimicrobiia bacterium]
MDAREDLRAFLRSGRPAVELEHHRATYRRTRVATVSVVVVAVMFTVGRFESPTIAVGGILGMCFSVLLHALVRKRASLLEMIVFDTILYVGATVFADAPELPLFVAMSQLFILFLFVPGRAALVAAFGFLVLAWIATAINLANPTQQRTAGDTMLLVVVVAILAAGPSIWTQLRAGAGMHRLRARQEQLAREKDQLLADKDRFVASVSHEIRTPLTAVVGLAHTLAEANGELSVEERDEFVDTIVEQGEEVASIVEDLLVAARAGSGHLALVVGEVDLAEEVQSVTSDEVEVTVSGPLVVVGDPVRVRQVLRNLVSNAMRYGGPTKRVALHRRGVLGIVSVQDDGPAIPPEDLDTIFAAYGRAHDRPGRTDSVGLGLTVSRQLARMMGGDVSYSHDGRWASFQLTLPLAVTDTAKAIRADPAEALAAHGVTPRPEAD